jgi:riboflavin kinase/FMN adenylyltransferase
MFDGVHLGHRRVIEGSDTVVTFDPHPLAVVRPEAAPPLLTSVSTRAQLLAGLGVREMVVIPFDLAFARSLPEAFVDEVLVGALAASRISVGANFRFGRGGSGTVPLLAADGRFDTRVVPLLEHDGAPVSSTRIRRLILAGEVERAAELLGRPLRVDGTVVGPGQLAPEVGCIRPPSGRYECRVEGATTTAQVDPHHVELAGSVAGDAPPGGKLAIELLRRLDAAAEVGA